MRKVLCLGVLGLAVAGMTLLTPATSAAQYRRGYGLSIDIGPTYYAPYSTAYYYPRAYPVYEAAYYPSTAYIPRPAYGWWTSGYRAAPAYYVTPAASYYYDWCY
jgi:hypothetical protein